MAPSRFSEAQILAILQEAQESRNVAEVCERHGISIATFYRWRKSFGHLLSPNKGGTSRRLNGSK